MSHEHHEHETVESTDGKNKTSTLAAFGFVTIIIILIISAANYLRIQEPRFNPIEHTEKVDMQESDHHAVEAQDVHATEQPAATPQEDTQAH